MMTTGERSTRAASITNAPKPSHKFTFVAHSPLRRAYVNVLSGTEFVETATVSFAQVNRAFWRLVYKQASTDMATLKLNNDIEFRFVPTVAESELVYNHALIHTMDIVFGQHRPQRQTIGQLILAQLLLCT